MIKEVIVGTDIDTSAANINDVAVGQIALFLKKRDGSITQMANAKSVQEYEEVIIVRGPSAAGLQDHQICTPIQGKGVMTWANQAPVTGTKKRMIFGYTLPADTNNFPVNLYNGVEYSLNVRDIVTDENSLDVDSIVGPSYSHRSSILTTQNDHGRYDIIKSFADQINTDFRKGNSNVRMLIRHSETEAALANNVTVSKGSDLVTCTAHVRSVGDYLSLAGSLYRVVKVVDANTLKIDRKYEGDSETILKLQATAANCDVVNGSTTVTCADTTGMVAGGYVNLGGAVYEIISIVVNTTFVIDRPYESVDDTLTAGVVPGLEASCLGAAGYIASATIDSDTYFGADFTVGDYDQDFDVNLDSNYGFDGGEVETTTDAVTPKGDYISVRALEESGDADRGNTNKTRFPQTPARISASGSTYDCYVVEHEAMKISNMGKMHYLTVKLIMFVVTGGQNAATYIVDYFQDWMLTSQGQGTYS